MRPVIVITGKKGSGKDTFGEMVMEGLSDKHPGMIVSHASFAKPLKDLMVEYFNVPYEVSFGDHHTKESTYVYGKSVRFWQQLIGTEWFRDSVHEDFWVHKMLRTIVGGGSRAWVITDCRFPNEWGILRAILERRDGSTWNGRTVPVECLPRDYQRFSCHLLRVTRPGFEDQGDGHASETSIDLLDQFGPHLIVNDGDLADLQKKAEDFLENL